MTLFGQNGCRSKYDYVVDELLGKPRIWFLRAGPKRMMESVNCSHCRAGAADYLNLAVNDPCLLSVGSRRATSVNV